MNKTDWKTSLREAGRRHSSRKGAFSAGLTALAVAAVLLVNILMGQLPTSATQFDMAGTGIYDVTDTSVTYLSALDQPVELHVLASEDSVDSRIVRFLDGYLDLSDQLTLDYTDPVIYPSVLTQYGAEANTIVVTAPATGRQEIIDIEEIIGYDMMSYYYYGTYTETDFDAEGLLLSAIDGVLTESTRTVYQTTGHDETAMPLSVEELFKKAHMAVEQVNLLTDGGIPADCDLLVLNAPTRDLADDELTMLLDYLTTGGQVILALSSQETAQPNFAALCQTYGLTLADGMIADGQRYYQNNPYLFFPLADTGVDAAAGLTSDATVLWYASRGFTLTDPQRENVTVHSFLTTSDQGFAVTETGEQVQGTYAVAAVATEEIDDGIVARLTVYGSDSLINADLTASFTNLDNTALFLSAATCGFTDVSAVTVEPVSLETPVNTIATGGLWALLFIFVIPATLLIFGFVHWMRRRKL